MFYQLLFGWECWKIRTRELWNFLPTSHRYTNLGCPKFLELMQKSASWKWIDQLVVFSKVMCLGQDSLCWMLSICLWCGWGFLRTFQELGGPFGHEERLARAYHPQVLWYFLREVKLTVLYEFRYLLEQTQVLQFIRYYQLFLQWCLRFIFLQF